MTLALKQRSVLSRAPDDTTTTRAPAKPKCKHHWMIDSPAGPVADAWCKICGATRTFKTGYSVKQRRSRRKRS